MKKFLLLIILVFISCERQKNNALEIIEGKIITSSEDLNQMNNLREKIDTSEIEYFQSHKATFKKFKKDTLKRTYNQHYEINTTNYKVFRVLDTVNSKVTMTYHLAKINKISMMTKGAEGGITKISAEIRNFDNPNVIEFIIAETKSDEIIFEPNLYRIIEYGCCSFNGWIKLYNYKHELIAEGEPDEINNKYPEW